MDIPTSPPPRSRPDIAPMAIDHVTYAMLTSPPPPPRPDITPWVLVPPDLREPRPDPLWVSALRGRLLAVLASGGSLILSGDALWRLYGHIRAEGLTAEHLSTLSALSGSAYDAVTALSVSVLSLAALAAAGLSKLRERRRRPT